MTMFPDPRWSREIPEHLNERRKEMLRKAEKANRGTSSNRLRGPWWLPLALFAALIVAAIVAFVLLEIF